jgi:hypothetical protein
MIPIEFHDETWPETMAGSHPISDTHPTLASTLSSETMVGST